MKHIFSKRSIISHVIIVLIFFGGMFLNYFLLFPIIDSEETKRYESDCNDLVNYYLLNSDRIKKDPHHVLDSLYRNGKDKFPYNGSVFCIADSDGSLIVNEITDAATGTMEDIRTSYGEDVFRQVKAERVNPKEKGTLVYDKKHKLSYFTRYDEKLDLTFFYVVDYILAGGDEAARALHILISVLFLGGCIISGICFGNIRRQSRRAVNEIATRMELDMAASIQQSMLPKDDRHLMQLDIDARLLPAKRVGGDLYYYLLRDGQLFFCIGDVSGKGIPASLCMSRAISLFRTFAQLSDSPAEITKRMNEELCLNNEQNMFLTSIIGVITSADGSVKFCNCGHDMPLYWNGKSDSDADFLVSDIKNLPLGFETNTEFKEFSMEMESEAMLFFYTDGVTEARNKKLKLLGKEKMKSFINGVKSLRADEINDEVVARVRSFASGENQSDDITIMTFRNICNPKSIVIGNKIKELRRISSFMTNVYKECALSGKDQILVRSGLDEAMTNCVKYAYPDSDGTIKLEAKIRNKVLIFTITDSGMEFNPLTYKKAVSDEMQVGGLGIQMMKSHFDDIEYERKDNKNILTLKKNLVV